MPRNKKSAKEEGEEATVSRSKRSRQVVEESSGTTSTNHNYPRITRTSSTQKQKQEDKEKEGSLPTLPASIWGIILSNYCICEELRNCLAVNKFFRHHVPPHVERLYIQKATELHRGYFNASRFPAIQQVFVYSLMSVEHYEWQELSTIRLCTVAARAVVPFLEGFPKLNRIHLGGDVTRYPVLQDIDTDNHCTRIDLPWCTYMAENQEQMEAYRDMMNGLLESFERGSLQADKLKLTGLLAPNQLEPKCANDDGETNESSSSCQRCLRICRVFPLDVVAKASSSSSSLQCLSKRQRLSEVTRRDPNFLKQQSDFLLCSCLEKHSVTFTRVIDPHNGELFRGRAYFEQERFEEMEELCREFGCDPALVKNAMPALQKLSWSFHHGLGIVDYDGKVWIARHDFDRLVQIGFLLSESDFQILQPLPPRSEEEEVPVVVVAEKKWIMESDIDYFKEIGRL